MSDEAIRAQYLGIADPYNGLADSEERMAADAAIASGPPMAAG
jgi:hypothetical protein